MKRKSQNTVCNLTVDMIDDYVSARIEELNERFAGLRQGLEMLEYEARINELHKLRTITAQHRCGLKHIRHSIPALARRQAN